jgi:hypothetical protein
MAEILKIITEEVTTFLKGELTREKVRQWIKNTITFSLTLLVGFLTSLQAGIPLDKALYFVYVGIVNALIDLTRKWKNTN